MSVEILWQTRIVSVPKESHDLDNKGQLIKETCNSWNKLIISQKLSTFCAGEIDVNWIWFPFWSKNHDKIFQRKFWKYLYNCINLTIRAWKFSCESETEKIANSLKYSQKEGHRLFSSPIDVSFLIITFLNTSDCASQPLLCLLLPFPDLFIRVLANFQPSPAVIIHYLCLEQGNLSSCEIKLVMRKYFRNCIQITNTFLF